MDDVGPAAYDRRMEADAPPLKACGVLVIRTASDDPAAIREFLLMRHADRWDLPKGHVDPGEIDETTTALRELQEETGLPPSAVALDPEFRFTLQYPVRSERTGGAWRQKTLVTFLGRLLEDSPIQTTEHLGYQWFPWSPPHAIQPQTIDPLLAAVAAHLAERS